MSDVTDDMLMAYADGVLEPGEIARVEKRLAKDPGLARRLALFEKTSGRVLAPVYDDVLTAPVPDRLLRAAGGVAVAAPAPAPEAAHGGIFGEMFGRLIEGVRGLLPQGTPGWAAATALGCVLLAGVFAARKLSEQVPDPQPFRIALETAQSNTSIRFMAAGGERRITPVLSFQDREGRFCRKYHVVRADTSRVAGIACRDATGDWKIDTEADAGRAPRIGAYETVGAPAIDDRIVDMIKGDAFGRAQEDEFLKKGWK